MSEPCSIQTRIERIDGDSRDLAIEIAKLTGAIDRLDERIDRTDQSLEKLVMMAGDWQAMALQMSRVEILLKTTQEADHKLTQRIDEVAEKQECISDRVEKIENTNKMLMTAIRWIVAAIGALALQFSGWLAEWISSHAGPAA